MLGADRNITELSTTFTGKLASWNSDNVPAGSYIVPSIIDSDSVDTLSNIITKAGSTARALSNTQNSCENQMPRVRNICCMDTDCTIIRVDSAFDGKTRHCFG